MQNQKNNTLTSRDPPGLLSILKQHQKRPIRDGLPSVDLVFSTDSKTVESIVKDPQMYKRISADGAPKDPDGYRMPQIDGVNTFAWICYIDGAQCGCLLGINRGNDSMDVHVCLTRGAAGRSAEIGDLFVRKVFSETGFETIKAPIPEDIPLALRMAVLSGFEFSGYRKPYSRAGIPVRVIEMVNKKCHL